MRCKSGEKLFVRDGHCEAVCVTPRAFLCVTGTPQQRHCDWLCVAG